jgi:hypothetical protein
MTHHIHLRKPWNCRRSLDGVVWERRFNKPTGLDGGQRVFVVVENAVGDGIILFNGRSLGPLSSSRDATRYEVTAELDLHNRLEILLEPMAPEGESELPAEVRLEIVFEPC